MVTIQSLLLNPAGQFIRRSISPMRYKIHSRKKEVNGYFLFFVWRFCSADIDYRNSLLHSTQNLRTVTQSRHSALHQSTNPAALKNQNLY